MLSSFNIIKFLGDRIDLYMCVVSTSSSCGHDVRRSLFVLITYVLLTMVCKRIKVNVNVTMFIPLFDNSSSVIQCHYPY